MKARCCRFLDAKGAEGWRSVFTTDVVVMLDMAVSTGGAGHYHETYERHDGTWRTKTLHLTRTIQQISGDNA